MTKLTTRKYKDSKCVEETVKHVDWEPNEADLDIVTVGCDCGNTFNIPWDAMVIGGDSIHCGQCGEAGKMKIVEDPAKGTKLTWQKDNPEKSIRNEFYEDYLKRRRP